MDGRIFHLKRRLFENSQRNWTIKEMAEVVDLSMPHFKKLFKTETGTAPIAYLRDLRLEKARELLETKFYQLKQIGFEVGMSNDSHFTHDFKKKYGLTPTAFRKKHWEKIQTKESEGRE